MEQLKKIRKMPVSALMTKDIVAVDRNETVARVLQRMKQQRTTAAIVKPRDAEDVYGIVTERDILEKVIDPGSDIYRDPWNTPVCDIMSKPIISVYPEMSLKYAIRLMKKAKIRHLAVMNGKALLGLLSETDIMWYSADFLPPEGEHVAL